VNDIIHLLPDSVANQIAAGEVVQRPASIIKEMVENSIDADATQVQVLVTDGGKTNVQIIDNGKGMSETDARLAFERHATSKIQKGEDLFSLTTMGFRGEALASIAAVAQVELKTRRPEDELGTFIQLSGSHVERQEPVACSVGSNFLVKNLFFNVPARRKFLKSTQTELTNILTEFERIVLVYPHIEFSLHSNGVEVYQLRATNQRQRIVDVFGKRMDSSLIPIEVDTSIVHITGYVGVPESSRKKGSRQFFFVNGRYMRHPFFHSALKQAYSDLIPTGEHVSYFIYFTLDPSEIDVNVHPSKTEVKFNNEQPIWQILLASVKEALGKYVQVPTIDFDTTDRLDIPVMGQRNDSVPMPHLETSAFSPFSTQNERRVTSRPITDWQTLYGSPRPVRPIGDTYEVEGLRTLNSLETESRTLWDGTADGSLANDHGFTNVPSLPRMQLHDRYIVVAMPDGLLVIDQHRAHTRVLYEEYMQKINLHEHLSQGLLFPQLVEFTQAECTTLETIQGDLDALGFELTNLGGGTYNVTGVPSALTNTDASPILHGLIYAAMEGGIQAKEEIGHSLALAFSQSMAIGYGQPLSDLEMEDLLERLFQLSTPALSPDGKPVFCLLSASQIEKLF